MHAEPIPRPRNALLQSLSPLDWDALRAALEAVEIPKGEVLYEMGDPVVSVFFPETGLVSVIFTLAGGEEVETSVVGREGGLGFLEALGSGVMNSRLLVQVPGRAYKVPAKAFITAFRNSESFQTAVHKQLELLQAESRLSIACRSAHPVNERFCRWILECMDLSGHGRTLPLSQELLAIMLGVQRTTVSAVAGELQEHGVIQYQRGRFEILDTEALEHGACACRAALQALRADLAPETFGDHGP